MFQTVQLNEYQPHVCDTSPRYSDAVSSVSCAVIDTPQLPASLKSPYKKKLTQDTGLLITVKVYAINFPLANIVLVHTNIIIKRR